MPDGFELLEALREGVWAIDAEARTTFVNARMAEMLGYRPDEMLGRSFFDFVEPTERAGAEQRLEMCRAGIAEEHDLTFVRKDGARVEASLSAAPLLDAEGRHVGAVALVTAVGEKRRAEAHRRHREDMERENRLLAEAGRLHSAFLAQMSHELRTPLNAIIGFAQVLRDRGSGLSENERRYVNDILAAGRGLLAVINDVLDYTAVQSGAMTFHPEPVDLRAIVSGVVDDLREIAASRSITVRCETDAAPVDVRLDAVRLRQILYNYLSNALKFSHPGGVVSVRVLPEGDDELRVEVEDRGIGVAPEAVPRLFHAFAQIDGGHARRYPGTGLGLALTRRIVEAQGGTVGVRTKPGEGSVFWAVLPRRPRRA